MAKQNDDRYLAVYARVSSRKQDTKSQEPDLKRWLSAYADGRPIRWFHEKATGTTMNRPAWRKLEADVDAGKVSAVVVWRLDRLGRTASGLTTLFDKLVKLRINLVSVKDSLDLSTAAGRLLANVLASVAAYETEIRRERTLAGQAVAKSNGRTWGGSQKGRRWRLTNEAIATIQRMHREEASKAAMARATGLSRPTVYAVIEQHC